MNFESLRNKFDKLRNDWAEDSHVDFQFKNKEYSADLGQLALDIPFQHNKYLNLCFNIFYIFKFKFW